MAGASPAAETLPGFAGVFRSFRAFVAFVKLLVDEIDRDRIFTMAGSVAYFGVLAVFPALIATIAIYGLIADPADVVAQIQELSFAIPDTARALLANVLADIAEASPARLKLGLVLSLAFSFYSASSGVDALMEGVNAAYGEKETRSWLRRRALALKLTVGLSLFVIVAVGLITALPEVLDRVGLGEITKHALNVLRWPLLVACVMAGLAVLYRVAPNRPRPAFRATFRGALVATVLWLFASLAFSVYAENFGRFNKTYGTLGAVIVLLLWLYFSAVAILIGAEVNAELERRARRHATRVKGKKH